MPEENIDEIIQEILGEKKEEEVSEEEILEEEEIYECPVCHHTVPSDAKFCPYCFAVFDENVDYKMLIETLIRKLKSLLLEAKNLNIPLKDANRRIHEARQFALKRDFPSGYSVLQDVYVKLIREVVDAYNKKLEEFKRISELSDDVKKYYEVVKEDLKEWDVESLKKNFKELEQIVSEISKEVKAYVEKLEEIEKAVEIARRFNINTEKAEKIVNNARAVAENKKYKGAMKILDDTFIPIKGEVENAMKNYLRLVKNEVTRATYSGGAKSKDILRTVRELKVYWDEENIPKVLIKMDEIDQLLSE